MQTYTKSVRAAEGNSTECRNHVEFKSVETFFLLSKDAKHLYHPVLLLLPHFLYYSYTASAAALPAKLRAVG